VSFVSLAGPIEDAFAFVSSTAKQVQTAATNVAKTAGGVASSTKGTPKISVPKNTGSLAKGTSRVGIPTGYMTTLPVAVAPTGPSPMVWAAGAALAAVAVAVVVRKRKKG
jgi:hypothetical protein